MFLTHLSDNTTEYNGTTYELDLAFNNVLSVFDILGDNILTTIEKVDTALYMLTNKEVDEMGLNPIEKTEMLSKIFEQHVGDAHKEKYVEYDLKGNPMPAREDNEMDEIPYSFVHDAEYIYASFVQAYGIDLFEQHGKLNWKQFKSLMAGLPDTTIFRRVVNIRTEELPTGKGTEKQREELKKLKKIYALPNTKEV